MLSPAPNFFIAGHLPWGPDEVLIYALYPYLLHFRSLPFSRLGISTPPILCVFCLHLVISLNSLNSSKTSKSTSAFLTNFNLPPSKENVKPQANSPHNRLLGRRFGCCLTIAFHEALQVYATARNPSKMEQVASLGIETITLDVQSESSIAACVSKMSSLDILVNNAGA